MPVQINEPISVELIYDGKTRQVYPRRVGWRGRIYQIKTVGLHHLIKEGTTLLHVFSVTDGTTFFRLVFNTKNLHWKLTEVEDGIIS